MQQTTGEENKSACFGHGRGDRSGGPGDPGELAQFAMQPFQVLEQVDAIKLALGQKDLPLGVEMF
jgi:hypothetical protein